MTGTRIHKRMEHYVAVGETMRCGVTWFNVSPRHSFQWRDVTCKNCLKHRVSA